MPTRPRRILCVDDNPQLLSIIKSGLEPWGFEVVTAGHGMEALGLFKKHKGEFVAILTNHQMPQMDGAELIQLIRSSGFSGKVIVMSSSFTNPLKAFYRSVGVQDFLTKPFGLSPFGALLSKG